jgi:flagellar protein FliS
MIRTAVIHLVQSLGEDIMFNMPTAIKAYSNVALDSRVTGSNAHQLITLLYDGAVEALEQARMYIQSQQIGKKSLLLNKAIAIINEGLLASLNVEAGGELARNLAGLYDYMTMQLVKANQTNQVEPVIEVIRLLSELREAWLVIDPGKKAGIQGTKNTASASSVSQFMYS